MKYAGHTNQMTMTRDYLSSIAVVDGLASFLKLPPRNDQDEDFRSMTVKRNPEFCLSLPAKIQDELRQREEYVAITNVEFRRLVIKWLKRPLFGASRDRC